MDNEVKKLLGFVDSMGKDNRALFQAIMQLDAAPRGTQLRLIKKVNQHILERKLNEQRRETRIKELNEFHAKEQEEEKAKSSKGSSKSKKGTKSKKADPGTGESCELPSS